MGEQYSYQEVAQSFELWGEYVDPEATMTQEEFEEMPVAERVAIQVKCFGKEQSDWQNTNDHADWVASTVYAE